MFKFPLRQLTLFLLAGTYLSGQALALESSGTVVDVDPKVDASGPEGQRLLEVDGAVFMGDEIVAGPNGLAQIRFIDDTKIIVGPNSRLKIDSFVFRGRTAERVAVNAIKGVFRFISGDSPHQAYSIRTPTMTIGVRGTVVDINARGPDSSAVFLEGAGTLCDTAGQCLDVIADCSIHIAPRGGGFVVPTGQQRAQRLDVFFPFIGSQTQLDPAFVATTVGCSNGGSQLFNVPPDHIKNSDHVGAGYGISE